MPTTVTIIVETRDGKTGLDDGLYTREKIALTGDLLDAGFREGCAYDATALIMRAANARDPQYMQAKS